SLIGNLLVHKRLSETRLISFVVTVLPVTDNVNNHILLEGGTPFRSQLTDEGKTFDIVSIYVENRRIDGLRDIGTVGRRASETRIGGKANLIVDNKMNGTAGGVGGE